MILYFQKIMSIFPKDHLEKLTITCPPLNCALPIARIMVWPIAELTIKNMRKYGRGRSIKFVKRAKKAS